MSRAQRKVLVVSRWLGKTSEPWLYRQVTGLKTYRPHMAVEAHLNPAWYPMTPISLLVPSGNWDRRMLRMRQLLSSGHWPSRDEMKIAALRHLLMDGGFNVVHVHFLWNDYVLDAVRGLGLPLVFTAHGSDVTGAFGDESYRHRLTALFAGVDKIVAVSGFIRDRLIGLGCPATKIEVLPLGVPTGAVRSPAPRSDDMVRFISVGSLLPIKGHLKLLQALELALQQGARLALTIVGDGELRTELEAEIRSRNLADHVTLSGALSQQQVSVLLQASDVYVQMGGCLDNPQAPEWPIEEGLPISYVEAASHGLPLIGSRAGGIPEICHPGQNGYLEEPGDVAAVAEHMVALAGDDELRMALGNAARHTVLQQFDCEVQTARLEALYDRLCQADARDD